MRALLALAILTAVATSVLAARGAEPAPSPKEGAPGTNVDMPILMAPLTGADGKLSGYAYVTTRLTASSEAGALDVRDKIAFVQDAFVRDVNGASVSPPGDTPQLDNGALQGRLLADARRIMGPGKVASIAVTQVQIAPLHPNPVSLAASPPPDMPAAQPAKPATKP